MMSQAEPAASTSVTSTVKPVAELASDERERLYKLMSGHFANVDREQFFHDLDEKRSIVLVTDTSQDRLCGFSTLTLIESELDGRPIAAVFAGDTVMEPAYWGHHGWVRAWGRHAYEL